MQNKQVIDIEDIEYRISKKVMKEKVDHPMKEMHLIVTNAQKFQNIFQNRERITKLELLLKKTQKEVPFLVLETCWQNQNYFLYLFDEYSELNIQQGIKVFVSGRLLEDMMIFSNEPSNSNYFLLEPQLFISASQIRQLQFCRRKLFLKKYFTDKIVYTFEKSYEFKQSSKGSTNQKLAIFDCIPSLEERRHHIYQLKLKDYPSGFVGKMKEFYKDNPWIHDVKQMDVRQMVMKFFHEFLNSIKWIYKYMLLHHSLFDCQIVQLIECEKKIQCPYGLDGMIDIVVKIEQVTQTGKKEYYMPIELKTGEEYTNYEQQLLLLNLSKKGENQIINYEQKNLVHILLSRNYFVSKLMVFEAGGSYTDLPSLNQEFHDKLDLTYEKCKICQQQTTCYGINAIFEQDQPPIPLETYRQLNNQLKDANNKEYLTKMLQAIRQEEIANKIVFQVTQILSNLKFYLQSIDTYQQQNALAYLRDLKEEASLENQLPFRIFNSNGEAKNKYILTTAEIISDSQPNKYFVTIQIGVKSEKMDHLITQDSQLLFQFKGQKQYQVFENQLIQFVLSKDYCPRKRQVLIQGRVPIFVSLNQLDNNLKQSLLYIKQKFSSEICQKQINVITKCIRAKDFALIDGNQKELEVLLFYLLNLFLHSQKTVLVCTNFVDRLLKSFVNLLTDNERKLVTRFQFYKENVEVPKQYQIICYKNFTIERYTEIIQDKQAQNFIFFCTPQFVLESQIKEQTFDYCFVNEASSIVEPLCLQCLLKGKIGILLGDSEQPELKSYPNQLGTSLFKRLQEEEIQRSIIN